MQIRILIPLFKLMWIRIQNIFKLGRAKKIFFQIFIFLLHNLTKLVICNFAQSCNPATGGLELRDGWKLRGLWQNGVWNFCGRIMVTLLGGGQQRSEYSYDESLVACCNPSATRVRVPAGSGPASTARPSFLNNVLKMYLKYLYKKSASFTYKKLRFIIWKMRIVDAKYTVFCTQIVRYILMQLCIFWAFPTLRKDCALQKQTSGGATRLFIN